MIRAQDKVEEAKFFWNKYLEALNKNDLSFKFLFSAFLSSARAIGWVLQKDLRGAYGKAFDTWWESKKIELQEKHVDIEILNRLRILANKHGNEFFNTVFSVPIGIGPIDRFQIMLDDSRGLDEINGCKMIIRELTVDIPDELCKDDEILLEHARKAFLLEYQRAIHEIYKRPNDFSAHFEGFTLHGETDLVDIKEVHQRLRDYLVEMRDVVEEASRIFPLPKMSINDLVFGP